MKREKKKAIFGKLEDLEAAIKAKCVDCMCGQIKIDCGICDCSIYPFSPEGKRRQSKRHSGKDS